MGVAYGSLKSFPFEKTIHFGSPSVAPCPGPVQLQDMDPESDLVVCCFQEVSWIVWKTMGIHGIYIYILYVYIYIYMYNIYVYVYNMYIYI